MRVSVTEFETAAVADFEKEWFGFFLSTLLLVQYCQVVLGSLSRKMLC
jgi:hypothetical protein